ncbi:MAG: putative toxin-antitoxin system toxin component, PIN family [Xanthomonadales bacterium]|nr:putative toxin-antitoxin system toxin component, PIN family [Xanthomonadales bacterium]
MSGMRVVLDTNVLVSGLAYPGSVPGRIVGAWRQGGLDVALSRYILDELSRVLPRMSRLTLTAAEILDLVDSLRFIADVVEPDESHGEVLRDPADAPVLATWKAANAQYLITGDKDLLAVAAKYPIITPADLGAARAVAERFPGTLTRACSAPSAAGVRLDAPTPQVHRTPSAWVSRTRVRGPQGAGWVERAQPAASLALARRMRLMDIPVMGSQRSGPWEASR